MKMEEMYCKVKVDEGRSSSKCSKNSLKLLPNSMTTILSIRKGRIHQDNVKYSPVPELAYPRDRSNDLGHPSGGRQTFVPRTYG